MLCCACQRSEATIGVLCAECRAPLGNHRELAPEQIDQLFDGATTAALVDPWGHPFHLAPTTRLGRALEGNELVVLHGSVSRHHATIHLDGAWYVTDLASEWGTSVRGREIKAETRLVHGDRIALGEVAFLFVADAPRMPPRPPSREMATLRVDHPRRDPDIELQAPSGGGGGYAVVGGKQVKLTMAQYELLERLIEQARADADKPDDARGFVSTEELMKLSLEVPEPDEDHVRQLVYRARRALLNAGVGDLIETRRGVGYRLRIEV